MTRPNSKGAGIASADAPETHENGQRNFASDEGIGKAFATMRAQLELVGYCLTRAYAEDGSVRYFVGRWGLCRELANVAAVHTFPEHACGALAKGKAQ